MQTQDERRRDAVIAASVAITFTVVLIVGVLLPNSRAPSIAEDVDPAAAQTAVMLTEVHRDHPIQRMTSLTYDVRRFDPEADEVPMGCSEANARDSLVVTARTIWFLHTTKTLVGNCGMVSM